MRGGLSEGVGSTRGGLSERVASTNSLQVASLDRGPYVRNSFKDSFGFTTL